MKKNKLVDITGTIILFIGMFLTFLPHALHVKAGLDNETSHLRHVVFGFILIVIALAILIYNNKALKFQNKR